MAILIGIDLLTAIIVILLKHLESSLLEVLPNNNKLSSNIRRI